MILIISTCKEPLHELEFVKPVEKILLNKKIYFFTKHYSKINEADLKKADKVIICGTSLKDNKFLKDIKKFIWIKEFQKPLLGICAGMQIVGLLFNGKIRQKQEIGFYEEMFKEDFLEINGKQEVYHLHNNYCTLPKNFEKFTNSKIPQAIKHKFREIYGVLFHPEVRNHKIIENFCKLQRI
jgi:GMP synthase (glutamine-hydrolysing)